MRFTVESDRATRVVLYLAVNYPKCISAKEIAENEKIPARFTLKILRKLKLAEIVDSLRGNAGGYLLSKKPEEISLYDVITAIEGPLCIQKCLENPDNCNLKRADVCPVHNHLCDMQHYIKEKLVSVNFLSLAEDVASKS